MAAVALFAGTWLSGYFIVCTNAFMQHPSVTVSPADGPLFLADFWTFLLNPWAHRAVRAHHDCLSRDGIVRRRRGRAPTTRFSAPTTSTPESCCASGPLPASSRACSSPSRREIARPSSSRSISRSRSRPWRATSKPPPARHRPHRPAQRARRRLDNPLVVPRVLSFLAYGTWHADVRGSTTFHRRVARQRRAALLLVPHHGRPRHALHPDDGRRRPARMARTIADTSRVAVGPDAGVSVSLHRDDCRLDDGGARASAVADLRADADRSRLAASTSSPARPSSR